MRPTRLILIAAILAVLAVGSVELFLTLDAHSHSASDTLRPFIIIALPAWLLGSFAVRRLAK